MKTLMKKLSPTATDMIRFDHSHVMTNFHHYESGLPEKTKKALVNTICVALEVHAQLEEEIFYPAMRTIAKDEPIVQKSIPEHAEMRRLIGQLRGMDPTNSSYDDTLMELMRDVLHHVADEETTLLPDAEQKLGLDRLRELGAQMTKRRFQLAKPRAGEIIVNQLRAAPTSYIVAGTLALLAGTYVVKRMRNNGNNVRI